MPSYLRPGVYVQETLNPIQPIAGPNSKAVAAFVGGSDRGPTTPTLITSWSQYVTYFGSWNSVETNALPLAVYMFFSNGGNQAYVCRSIGTSTVTAFRNFNDRAGTPVATVKVAATNQGTWGNNINISIADANITGYFTITVFYGGVTSANIVETWPDLTMVSTDTRYAINIINAASNYIVLTDLGSTTSGNNKNPAVIANQSLTTGSDGSLSASAGVVSALAGFDVVDSSLILNIPGYTDATTVNSAIAYAVGTTRFNDVFVVVDGLSASVNDQLNLAATYTPTSSAAVYYPPLTIVDPTIGVGGASTSTKTIGAGSAVVGIYASTDASRGVFKAPAGLQARVAGAVSVKAISNSDLDLMNASSAPVNAIRFISGSGIVVMGARTLKPGYVDRYIPVRRSLMYLEKSLRDITRFAIFEPNDQILWSRINAACSSFLTGFWSQGGLNGGTPAAAFFVKCDKDLNPQSAVDNGIVNVQIGVALQRPAEFVVINIGQYSGGTTVTVA